MKRLTILLWFLPLVATAEVVVPIDAVESSVNIRLSPDAKSEIVGKLHRGDRLLFIESVPGWHEVEMPGGATGFVSADWSLVEDGEPAERSVAVEEVAPVEETTVVEETAPVEVAPQVEAAGVKETIQPVEATSVARETVPVEAAPLVEAAAVEQAIEPVEETNIAAETAPVEEPAMAEEPVPVAPAPPVAVVREDAFVEPMPVRGVTGPQGPAGPPGPPGPAGAGNVEGAVDFLVKFTAPTIGGNSQIFDDGNFVGIGTTEPEQRLEVNGNIRINEQNSSVAGLLITQSGGETGYIMHNRASTLTIGAGSIDRITIDRDGNVGFGVSRPSNPVELANGAHVTPGGVWTNSSSRARKENIHTLSAEEALEALDGLEPVQFNYRNDNGEDYVGFIAEDVPDLVATRDRDGLSAMDIVAVLTRVVQEQQKQIEALEARLENR